jgi:YD repeat-containing protein
MKKLYHMLWLGLLLGAAVPPSHAQDVEPYEEFGKHLRAAQEVTPLTSTLFGDKVSLYNGSTEFDVTDIDLPGNSGLPVRFGRQFVVEDRRTPTGNLAGLGDWDLDVPYIDGVFTQQNGWEVQGYNNTGTYSRCSFTTGPYNYLPATETYAPVVSIWDGNLMHIPGEADEDLLATPGSQLPAVADGNSYPWITKSFYRAMCGASTANGYPGESFIVVSPSGVRYTFNWALVNPTAGVLVQVPAPQGTGTVKLGFARSRVFLLATQVTDRFGNWVTYTYNAASQLTKIAANDGREIDITWSGNAVQTATAGTRTWTYGYGANGSLASVTRPDGSQWLYAITAGSLATVKAPPDTEPPPSYHCQIDPEQNTGSFTYSIVSPSGAQGTFNFVYNRNYHSFVPESCTDANPDTMYPLEYDFFDNFQLMSKQITGAGLQTLTWTYDYGSNVGGYFLSTVPGSVAIAETTYIPQTTVATKVVTVTEPGDVAHYTFGVSYGLDEGRMLQEETDSLSGQVVKTVTHTYLDDSQIANEPFPDNVGQSVQALYKNPMVGRLRPEISTVSVQDGDTYTHQNVAFDVFARPTQVNKYNGIPGQTALEEQTTYYDNFAYWVLGQTQQVSNMGNGEIETQRVYDPTTALMQSQARFGETLYSYTYNAAGQLASFEDGNSQTTTLSNYYRGIPQLVSYPDSTSQSATVDDYGEITAVTDQAGHTTNYQYDPSGWPKEIDYPTGDEVAWYPETYTFTYVTSAEQGIAAGHWRRTVSTGNNTEVTYFDAMLRPILSDTSIPGADISTGNAYDWQGKTTFTSYPVSGAASLATLLADPGTHNTYDALERVTQVQKDSELGALSTLTAYLSGAGTQITDPNGNVTTTNYQVFDEPSYSAPIKVQVASASNPNLTTQVINRDVYGKPLSITQSGLYNGTENDSVTKTLVYDIYERLCRTTEPESGDTVVAYDGANNIRFSATGLSITGTGCGREQVSTAAMTNFTYYPTNRVHTITPPAGTQSTQYIYDAVGNIQWAVSGISVWDASYNYRNMLTSESLHLNHQYSMTLGYSHDAYGNLNVFTYPNGGGLYYAPDALGRPTQVGGYASGITYWPNGQVKSFTYGNGTAYAASENTRQLLNGFSYGRGGTLNLSEIFSYDNDANMGTVQDMVNGQRSKIFKYDGLNRLTSAFAPGLSINESYTYDALNNLRSRVTGGQTLTYNYNPLNQLQSISNGASALDTFGYDNNGNQTNKNGNTLLFDQKDQLTQILNFDSYAYDAVGRRVLKTPVGGSPMVSFYDHGGQLMYQFVPGASQATNFVYLGTKLIARNAYTQFAAPGAITFDSNPNNGNYTVSWGAVPAAVTYTLQESFNGGAWTTTNVSGTSYAFTNRDGGSYVYQVQACSGANCGPWTSSATLGVTPALPALTVPSSLTFAPFTVSWSAPIGATSYTVQQSFNGGAWTTIASAITIPSFSVTSAPGGTYTFQVSASNAYGTRGWAVSAPVSVTQVPATPTNFVFSTNSSGQTVLTWDAMAWATSYQLTVYGTDGNLGTYLYHVGDPSFTLPSKQYKVGQLAACSIAGCSAQAQVNNTFLGATIKASTGASAVLTKIKRMLGEDTDSGSGCTATACTVTVGGSP